MPDRFLSPADLERLLQTRPYKEEDGMGSVDFSYLPAQLFARSKEMKDIFTERSCQPGEVLFEEDEPGKYIYIIVSGRLAIVKGDWSSPTVLGYRGEWQIIGEMALLDKGPRSASVVAVEPTRLLRTDWDGFRKLLGDQNFVGFNMLETLSHRLRQSDEDRRATKVKEQRLSTQISELESEKLHLLELQRVRQETTDLIVHDLRNPLGAIFMALRTLEFSLPEEEVEYNRDLLDAALSSCTRMQRLVDSMLEVARMESGDAVLALTQINLGETIEKIAHDTRTLQKDRIELQTDLPADLPTVVADRDKLERVIANLLDNAIKHSPFGARVVLAARLQQDQVQISVTDTGQGIPMEERQRIFERFNQVAREKARRRGFGLGLTYCKLTVQAHGGDIWVEEGEGGKGSRFVFTLPLKPVQVMQSAA